MAGMNPIAAPSAGRSRDVVVRWLACRPRARGVRTRGGALRIDGAPVKRDPAYVGTPPYAHVVEVEASGRAREAIGSRPRGRPRYGVVRRCAVSRVTVSASRSTIGPGHSSGTTPVEELRVGQKKHYGTSERTCCSPVANSTRRRRPAMHRCRDARLRRRSTRLGRAAESGSWTVHLETS